MNIELDRPLVVFDIEATGIDPLNDRIVEIGVVKVYPDGSKEIYEARVNPGISIPREATRIHGITDLDVAEAPTFREIAPRIAEIFRSSDVGGFGITRFDLPILQTECARHGHPIPLEDARIVDALSVFHAKERRDLTAAVRFYCERDHQAAHSALADAEATLEVLEAQVVRYPEIPRNVPGLAPFSAVPKDRFVDQDRKFSWRHGEAIFNFGKYRNRPLREVVERDAEYVSWVIESDFPESTKKILKDALDGKFPRRAPVEKVPVTEPAPPTEVAVTAEITLTAELTIPLEEEPPGAEPLSESPPPPESGRSVNRSLFEDLEREKEPKGS